MGFVENHNLFDEPDDGLASLGLQYYKLTGEHANEGAVFLLTRSS